MKKMPNCLLAMLLICLPCLLGVSSLTDPTRPPGVIFGPQNTASSQPLQLTAVFIYPNYRLAIINDQVALIGDHIGEFTITTISPYAVELTGPQNAKSVLTLTVPLKQEKH